MGFPFFMAMTECHNWRHDPLFAGGCRVSAEFSWKGYQINDKGYDSCGYPAIIY